MTTPFQRISDAEPIQSVFINREGFLYCCSKSSTYTIPQSLAKTFITEFFETWGKSHTAHLSMGAQLKKVSYNSQTSEWTYTFTEASPSELESLKERFDITEKENESHLKESLEKLSLEDQIKKVKDFIDSMDYKITPNNDFANLMNCDSNRLIATALPFLDGSSHELNVNLNHHGSVAPYDPLRSWTYEFDETGLITCQNQLAHIADKIEKASPQSEDLIQLVTALKEAGKQFPLQDPTRPGELIREMPTDSEFLDVLKQCFNRNAKYLTLTALADEVDAILQKVAAHQIKLLGDLSLQEEEKTSN